MATTGHTVKAFDEELGELRGLVLEMGGRAEAAIENSMNALIHRDIDAAIDVVANDHLINELEVRIENQAVRLIALRAPLADDLREIVAVMKIAGQIERVGDYAKNIGKRVPVIMEHREIEVDQLLITTTRAVRLMMKDVLNAFGTRDPFAAAEICDRDQVVDDLHNSLFRTLLTRMMEYPFSITAATHLIFVSKNLERIGDHATNIAEMVYYAATGEHMAERQHGSDIQL
jgi:phosphate transport system protein